MSYSGANDIHTEEAYFKGEAGLVKVYAIDRQGERMWE